MLPQSLPGTWPQPETTKRALWLLSALILKTHWGLKILAPVGTVLRGTSVKTLSSSNLSISLRVAARHSLASASSMASLNVLGTFCWTFCAA